MRCALAFCPPWVHENYSNLIWREYHLDTVKNNIENKPKVIRSYLNLEYSNPEERQDFLDLYFMDEKIHESFDELSDEEILTFIETTKKNIEFLKAQKADNYSWFLRLEMSGWDVVAWISPR